MKLLRHSAVACLTMLAALALWSLPAAAHTGFESSDPADGSVTEAPVDVITLVFTGDAEPTGDGFQVLDPDGLLREPTEATTEDERTWVLRFDPPIAGGEVGVRWLVKAPDAHPIDGAFSFTTPATLTTPSDASEGSSGAEPDPGQAAPATNESVALEEFLDTDDDTAATAGRIGAVGRAISLAGTLVGIGGAVFAATALRGRRRDVRHVLFWVRRAGVLVVAGAVVEFVAQIAIESAGSWSALWSPSAIGAVIASNVGIATALRIGGGITLAVGARLDTVAATDVADPVAAMREMVSAGSGGGTDFLDPETADARRGSQHGNDPLVSPGDHAWHFRRGSAGAAIGSAAILGAHLFDGHTVTKGNRLLTGFVDLVHVVGSAVWAGGVIMLAATLWLRHREGRDLRARQLAMRFSVVATVALVVVGLAGVILTIIVLDSPSELWTTEWGRVLIVKTVFVGVAAAAGGYNHKILIPLMDAAPDNAELSRRFRNVVTGEAAALVAVSIATAFLMGAAS